MDSLIHIIQSAGYWGYAILFIIIFLESFPPTFFLPGDSLLLTTGFLASQGYFSLPLLIVSLFLGSVIGYAFSYKMGKKLRKMILSKGDTFWFKRKHIEYTENFFLKYGAKTIIIGRFVAVVRSFGPTLAGAVEMPYYKFTRYSVLGGLFWTASLTSITFYLGKIFPNANVNLTPIIMAIIVVSLIPAFVEYLKSRSK